MILKLTSKNFLKEPTQKNVENFQTSLNLQQTYSVALCLHVNNIYHKILEIQWQLPNSTQHMNTGDVIQIDMPDFDPDIDKGLPIQEHQEAQGSASITQQCKHLFPQVMQDAVRIVFLVFLFGGMRCSLGNICERFAHRDLC